MLKKVFLLTIVFLLSLVFFLVVYMPVAWVWSQALEAELGAPLKSSGVRVRELRGTMWQGAALLDIKNIAVLANWELDPQGLWSLRLPLSVKLESGSGSASATASLSYGQTLLNLNSLEFELSALNQQLRRERIKLDGVLQVQGLSLELEDQKVLSAAGKLSWSGGTIAYPAGREQHERQIPSMRGELVTREDGLIELGVRDSGASFDIILGQLLPDGLARLQVKRRLLDLAQEPWSNNSTEQDTVFKVQKPIY